MAATRINPDDDEWEYEYSGFETQDFYVTLDLTSRVMPAHAKKGFVRLEHDIFADEEADKDKDKRKDGAHQDTPDAADDATPRNEQTAEPEEEEQDRIQIVGLHDFNPIISYQGQIYSCQWASTIGTDLHFARAPEDGDESGYQPLRKLNTYDLLGASSARLIATTSKLRPRSEGNKAKRPQAERGPTHTFAPIENPGSIEAVVKFPVPENATRAQKRQAGFLEKFGAVKARLGEKDKVRSTAYTSRGYNTLRTGEEEGGEGSQQQQQQQPPTFVTAESPPQSGDYTFITEDGSGSEPGSPKRSPRRQSPAATAPRRGRRGRRGSTAARPRKARRSKYDSPLRNELQGEPAGPSVERATPASWDELNQDGAP